MANQSVNDADRQRALASALATSKRQEYRVNFLLKCLTGRSDLAILDPQTIGDARGHLVTTECSAENLTLNIKMVGT